VDLILRAERRTSTFDIDATKKQEMLALYVDDEEHGGGSTNSATGVPTAVSMVRIVVEIWQIVPQNSRNSTYCEP